MKLNNIMIKKYIYLFLSGLLVFISGNAQINRHEYSVSLGGGISSLKYDTSVGDHNYGFGGDIGFGYKYFFNANWAVQSGVDFAYINAKTDNLNALSYAPGLKDSEGEVYDYYSAVSDFTERQHALFTNIPVMGHFQTEVFGANRFYVSAGMKVGIPIFAKYKTKGGRYENKGWYVEKENWADSQKFAGFGIFYDRDVKEDLDLKLAFMLSAETGIKWQLSNGLSLYTGVYCDYGLNDVSKNGHDNPLVTQEIQPDRYYFTTNSALESLHYDKYVHEGGVGESIIDKVVPISLGIKVRLAFN